MKTTAFRTLALVMMGLALLLCITACNGGDADGYVFTAPSGTEILVGAPAADVIAALGTPAGLISSPSCGGFDGLDYVYTYSGFRVSTTPAQNGDVICEVELIDDSVKTPEGLYIGMSRADVEAAMAGKGTPEDVGGNLVYTKGDVKLQVVFRSDYVSGITYVAK